MWLLETDSLEKSHVNLFARTKHSDLYRSVSEWKVPPSGAENTGPDIKLLTELTLITR